jgi:microcystin-dependent protein
MADLVQWQDADQFNVLRDKVNAIVDVVNAIVSVPIGGIQSYWGSPADAGKWNSSGIGVAGTQYEKFALCLGQALPGSLLQNFAGDPFSIAPDFRGRFPAGLDVTKVSFSAIGETGGSETVELTQSQMPRHQHSITVDDQINGAGGNVQGLGDGDGFATKYTNFSGGLGIEQAPSDGEAHNNLPPYLTTGFIIRYK